MKRTVKTTLLLAAHGSSRPGGGNPVALMARRLKAREVFADVCYGFLKQQPLLADVLSTVKTPELVVVPILSGHGYITDTLIPDALAPLARDKIIRLCDPLGCHPAIAGILAARALSVITSQELDRRQVSILLAAHGNAKNPENARQTKALADRIESLSGGLTTRAAFIEEEPLISSWPAMTSATNLIVLPFLIGGGLHGAEDIPNMLGLEAHDPALRSLSEDTPWVGPLDSHGRKIWCCRALGFEPAMSEIVLELAKSP